MSELPARYKRALRYERTKFTFLGYNLSHFRGNRVNKPVEREQNSVGFYRRIINKFKRKDVK